MLLTGSAEDEGIVWLAEKLEVEYRTPSGFFLSNNNLTEWLFGQVFEAINYLNEFGIEEINNDGAWIVETINSGNIEEAKKIVEKYKINLNY